MAESDSERNGNNPREGIAAMRMMVAALHFCGSLAQTVDVAVINIRGNSVPIAPSPG
jgi:hypothetical protein